MQYFVVNFCTLAGCRYWRHGDKCAKNGMDIENQVSVLNRMHESESCQIKQQMDVYRLTHMLEE